MSKKFELQIPKPCHENWEQMSPVEQGRFCSSCQKQVVDFSSMSDREVAQFFKKPSTGSVCGRFMTDQLNREIQVPKKRIPWVKYFFNFLLPGVLLSLKARTQGETKVIDKNPVTNKLSFNPTQANKAAGTVAGVNIFGDTVINPKPIMLGMITRIPVGIIDSTIINGKVVDEEGSPLVNVTVMIKGTRTGVITDAQGRFRIKPGQLQNDVTLVFSYVGHEVVERTVNLANYDNDMNVVLVTMKTQVAGLVVVATPKKKKEEKKTVIQKIFKKEQEQKFTIYPNPVPSNTTLHIEWKQLESGYHIVQLLNLEGQSVFTKVVFIDEEAKLLSIDLPSLTTGSYFLRMTNKKTNKSYSQKILVE